MQPNLLTLAASLSLLLHNSFAFSVAQKRDPWAQDIVTFADLNIGTNIPQGYAALNWDNLVVAAPDDTKSTITPPSPHYARTPVARHSNPVTAAISVDKYAQGYYGYSYAYLVYENEEFISMHGFHFACTAVSPAVETGLSNRACNLTVEAIGCDRGKAKPLTLGPYHFIPASSQLTKMKQVEIKLPEASSCHSYEFTARASGKSNLLLNLDNVNVTRSNS